MSAPSIDGGTEPTGKRRIPAVAVLSVLLLLSVVINVALVGQVRSLAGPLNSCLAVLRFGPGNDGPSKTAASAPRVGAAVPPLKAHDLGGHEVTLDVARPGKNTVLYVFSPHCVWCKRNAPNMRALTEAAGKRFDFVPISLDAAGVTEFLSSAGIHSASYADPSQSTRTAYGMGATPETIVVGPDGRIIKDWKGAYRAEVASEVSSVLGVRLPGLAE